LRHAATSNASSDDAPSNIPLGSGTLIEKTTPVLLTPSNDVLPSKVLPTSSKPGNGPSPSKGPPEKECKKEEIKGT
jgi:hypothetical protein